MINKTIDPRDIITVSETLTSYKQFNAIAATSSFIVVSTLTSIPNLVSSSRATAYSAFKGTTTLSGEGKNFYNHVVNYFYNQDPTNNFNPNLNYTDSYFTRSSTLTSLSAFTIITIDRGQVNDRITVSSITAIINNVVYSDGNRQSFNGLYRGTIYNGTSAYGDIFYDYGIIVLHGASGFSTNRGAFFSTINSATASSISAVGFVSESQNLKKRIFCRLFNYEFNYSNNPTALKSDGTFLNSLTETPTTYITEIGINSSRNGVNENVVVAKLSIPVKKTFQNELTFQVDVEL